VASGVGPRVPCSCPGAQVYHLRRTTAEVTVVFDLALESTCHGRLMF